MAISQTIGQGGELSLLIEGRLAIYQPQACMAAFLFSSHPKRERDREAHLNYYASAYNTGIQVSHHKTKLNQIQQNQACILH